MNAAINGFGRIGRLTLRTLLRRQPEIDVVAINDLADPAANAHLFKYDSNYGPFDGSVAMRDGSMAVNGNSIAVLSERDWTALDWGGLSIDLIIECTGVGNTRDMAARHLQAGAKKVLISAPSTDADVMVVLGVNHTQYDPEIHHIISNASCTTNGLAPPLKVLHDRFGIVKGQMTTVHSFTNSQSVLDLQARDLRGREGGIVQHRSGINGRRAGYRRNYSRAQGQVGRRLLSSSNANRFDSGIRRVARRIHDFRRNQPLAP